MAASTATACSVPLNSIIPTPFLLHHLPLVLRCCARSGHTATVLADGKILVAGGEASGSAEIFDPISQSFSLVSGNLNTPRQYHSAVLLNNGKVLIAGGVVGTNTVLSSAEIYDPQTQMFTPASGPMQTPRGFALLRVLPDGKVQVIGGDGEFSMEMFDPATNSFIALAHVPPHANYLNNVLASRTRSALITTIIQQNPVLQGQSELSAEILALLNRLDHTVTEIPQSNKALIAGGINDAGQILNSATVVSSSAATVTTDRFDYAPGEIVTITGRGWQPNETVWMLLHEEPETHADVITSSIADTQGNFTNMDFAPATADAGRSFTLTAIGQSSGFATQTAFKDTPRISASVTIGTQTPTPLVASNGNTSSYSVQATRSANGTVNAVMSVAFTSGTPAGITASFSPNPPNGAFTANGGTAFPARTLTFTTNGTTLGGSYPFTVTVADGSDQGTGSGTLVVTQNQTIGITTHAPASSAYGSTFPVAATASSGLTVAITTTGGCSGSGSGSATITMTSSATSCVVHYNQAGSVIYNPAPEVTETTTATKAALTITANDQSKTYGQTVTFAGTEFNASGLKFNDTVTSVSLTSTGAAATATVAGSPYAIVPSAAVGNGLSNYNITYNNGLLTVAKKDATWTTNPNSKTYGDSDPVPLTTGSGSGFLAGDNVTATYSRTAGETVAGSPYHITATLSPAGVLGNYNITNNGADFTINKKNATWTTNPNSKTYGDSDPVPLTMGSGSGFLAGDNVTATYSRTAGETVAGSPYHITATLSPAGVLGNYNITNNGADFTINKKNATWTTNPNSKTDGDSDPVPLTTGSGSNFVAADNVTASYSRVAGENVAGSPYHITATLSATGSALDNYIITNVGADFTINRATPIVTVTGGTFTYDGNPHGATVTVTGVGGAPVSGSTTLNYAGVPPTSYGPSTSAPTDAGTYQARSVFTSSDPNYNNAQGTGSITINKAASVTTVTVAGGESFTYDGNAHPANVSVTGAGGLNLAPAPVYSCGHAPVDVADSGCTASYTYLGDANHLGSSDSKTYTISKATPTLSVNGGTFTYDGATHGATTTVTGVGGAPVSGSTTLNYAGVPPTSYGPSTTAPTNAGTYQARAVFTSSDGNYTNAQGTAQIIINKADSTTTLSGTGTFTYDGLAHSATANVTGIGGLNQAVPVVYSGNCSAAPVNVNESPCSVSATYAGDNNHNGSSASGSIIMTKADASITVYGYNSVYDGFAHGTSGSATGVGGVNLSASLNLGATFINVPGGTAYWTFSGGVNYNDANGSVAIVITKADPVVTATGNTCTYNGSPCVGSGSAIGVNGESLTPVNIAYRDGLGTLMAAAPINAGVYQVAARYAGDNNYNQKQSAPATITILQASQAITVTREPLASAYYSNSFPVAATASSGLVVSINSSGSCSGSGGGAASITMTAGSGTCTITFDQNGDANYQPAAQVVRYVTALNTAPLAQAQSLATSEDVALDVILSASDIDNGSLIFSIVNPPAHGSLGLIGAPSCIPNGIGANCTASVTYSPASDFNGKDSFSFKVNDGQADSNTTSISITVNPVNDVPTANGQTVTANSGAPRMISLTGSDLETAAANLTLKIDTLPQHGSLTDGLNNILTSGSILAGSPATVIYTPSLNYEGPDNFSFTVTDRGDPDNCGAPSISCDDQKTSPAATVSITVTDATAPDTIIASMPASLSNNPNPSFTFTGADNVTPAGDLSFECKLDAGTFLSCTSPVTYTGVADGAHTFQVRAKDSFGNLDGTEASYSWTIDATAPDTMIDSAPSAIVNTSTVTFTFHSTENNSTFLCSLDNSPVSCSGGSFTTASLADGQHTFVVAAVDLANNADPTPVSVSWTIDTLAPDTTINSGPANPTTSTSATFTFSSANSPGDTYECRLDSAGFAPCTSPVTYAGLAVGPHSFQVRGKDAAGNMETSPASFDWNIGAVTLENYTMDTDFKRFDGFEVVYGRGTGSNLKINSTNPDSFHYQIKLTNNTGRPIGPSYGNLATAIITVPGMPSYCGGVPCSSQIGSLGEPAFVLKGRKVAHVWPGYHDHDGDDDDDDMPVTVKYMTQSQYAANGNSCTDNPNYSSSLPSDGAPKCIKITGFSIPVRHAARIRLNFHFRLKGTDGWPANSQQFFYAGFVFRATTSVSFGANVQTATDATGLVGAGKKATAIGGYAFNGAAPGTGYKVRLFTRMNEASCTVDTKLVAQDTVDANGFYYIWRSGVSQSSSTAPSLPSGVQYAVQLCNGATQIGLKTIDSRLREKEFEQVDFDY